MRKITDILLTALGFILIADTASAAPIVAYATTAWAAAPLFLKQFIIGALIGFAAKKLGLFGDDKKGKDQGQKVNKQSNDAGLPVIYGRTRVGGVRSFVESTDGTGSTDGTNHLVMALAICEGYAGPLHAIVMNDVLSWHPPDGTLTYPSGEVYATDVTGLEGKYASPTLIQWLDGQTHQEAAPLLLATAGSAAWSTGHKLQGVAYLAIDLTYDRDVYEGGVPTFTVEIDGKYILDIDETNGIPKLDADDVVAGETVMIAELGDTDWFGLTGTPYGKTLYTAGNFVVGDRYSIVDAGDTDFTLIGAADNNPGTNFTATGEGSGTGTANNIPTYAPGDVIYAWVDASTLGSSTGKVYAMTAGADQNPVDVLYDYLTNPIYGKGLDHTSAGVFQPGLDIDLDSFRAAKTYIGSRTEKSDGNFVAGKRYEITELGNTDWNAVAGTTDVEYAVEDRFVADNSGDSAGTGVADEMPLYEINGVVDTEQKIYDNVQEILSAFNAMLVYIAGQYKLRIKQNNETSVFSFTEDNIISNIEITLPDVNNRFNHISTGFFNAYMDQPGESYTLYNEDKAITKNSTYLAEDRGRKLEMSDQNDLVTDPVLIRQLNSMKLDQSRHGLACSIEVAHTAIQVEAGDIVDVTHPVPGWTNKLFRVLSITITNENTLDMVLQEYVAGDNL